MKSVALTFMGAVCRTWRGLGAILRGTLGGLAAGILNTISVLTGDDVDEGLGVRLIIGDGCL